MAKSHYGEMVTIEEEVEVLEGELFVFESVLPIQQIKCDCDLLIFCNQTYFYVFNVNNKCIFCLNKMLKLFLT